MRHLWTVKLLKRFAMEAQILFLILIIFSCIVEAQAVSVSDKLIVFQGHVFLSGGCKVKSDEDKGYRSVSSVSIDAVINGGVLSNFVNETDLNLFKMAISL